MQKNQGTWREVNKKDKKKRYNVVLLKKKRELVLGRSGKRAQGRDSCLADTERALIPEGVGGKRGKKETEGEGPVPAWSSDQIQQLWCVLTEERGANSVAAGATTGLSQISKSREIPRARREIGKI